MDTFGVVALFSALAYFVVWLTTGVLYEWQPLQGRVGVIGVTEAHTGALRDRIEGGYERARHFFAGRGIALDRIDCVALPPAFFEAPGWEWKLRTLGCTRLVYSYTGARAKAQRQSLRRRVSRAATELSLPAEPEVTYYLDADDLLFCGSAPYVAAEQEFVRLMVALGFDPRHADEKRLACYKRFRFVEGWKIGQPLMYATYLAAYEELAKEHGLIPLDAIREECRQIVATIYTYEPIPYEGVLETLAGLLVRGARLIVTTRGDEVTQRAKLRVSGVDALIERAFIMVYKSIDEYQAVVDVLEIYPPHAIAIGDSALYDVVPCMALGMHGAEVATGQFVAEYTQQARDPRVVRVKTLAGDDLKAAIFNRIINPNRVLPIKMAARRARAA